MSSELMEPAAAYHAVADMQDVGNHYGEVGQLGQGPYYGMPNLDPRLSNLLDQDMANIDLGGDASSEAVTPSKSTSVAHAKKGKKAKAAEDEDDDAEDNHDDEEDEEDEDEDEEELEDDEDEFTVEPAVSKKHRSATKSKATPRASKSTPKSSARTRKVGRKSAKVKDAVPFTRMRRAPKNGIIDSRPIPRSYEECDEADKALIDMRDKGKKTWVEVRVAWEEFTGQKTGASTLPNRYKYVPILPEE
jgi:hypothetical protein